MDPRLARSRALYIRERIIVDLHVRALCELSCVDAIENAIAVAASQVRIAHRIGQHVAVKVQLSHASSV